MVYVAQVDEKRTSPWTLDPDVTYLNHGGFGAAPAPVLAAQDTYRRLFERNPVRFVLETYQPALEIARNRLGEFLGAAPAGLVFVDNATSGVNSVLRSLENRLRPGDEIVVTNHGYNACNNAAEVTAAMTGAVLVVVEIPFPLDDSDTVLAAITGAVTEHTRLVMVDHITSPTALRFPIERIVAALEPDIPVLVDGAHAPGMVPLALDDLGASYVVGNCHKWMCAAKGAGYLWAREDRRDGLRHAVISHGYNGQWPGSTTTFHAQFDWVGTTDRSAWLTVPVAIDTVAAIHPDGWPGVMAANHALVVAGRQAVLATLDSDAPPAPEEMLGSMASLPLPDPAVPPDSLFDPLTTALRTNWSIEVPVFSWPESPRRLLRISAQRYNDLSDYVRLGDALHAELRGRARLD